MHDVEQWMRDRFEEANSAKERLKVNIFAELDKTPAVSVTVSYNGSGDSGDIESVTGKDADGKEILFGGPQCIPSEESFSTFNGKEWVREKREKLITLGEALEELAWHALEARHPGWEINEGSYGDLEIDVKERKLTLMHHTIIHDEEYEESSL